MDINRDEEHRGADRMHRLEHVSIVDVAANMIDRIECLSRARLIVHGKHDTRQELCD